MIIYNYHPQTGRFLQSSEADPSPLEEGVYLIPAHATEIQPPIVEAGEYVVFVGDTWQVMKEPIPEPEPMPLPLTLIEFNELQRQLRATTFAAELDTLTMKAARGEATQQELIDKAAEIRARFPYQE